MNSNKTVRETENNAAGTVRENNSHETVREHSSPVSASIGLQKFRDYSIDKQLPTFGAESDIYIVTKGPDKSILKLYRYGIKPKAEIIEKIVNLGKARPQEFVQVFGYGYDEGTKRWFEIQEYVQNDSLKTLIDDISKKDVEKRNEIFISILRQVSNALKVLHENDIVHRDLKPSNILLRSRDPVDLVLIDFGISSIIDPDLSKRQTKRAGTAMYQSPESLTELIGKPTDWWSLGMMALEAADGKHPFEGISAQVIAFLLKTKPIEIPESITPDKRELLQGLLTRDPGRRWGYDQVSRWLAGERNIRVYLEESVVESQALRSLKLMGDEHTSLETIARAVAKDDTSWAKGQELLMRGNIRTWLESNGELEQAKEVDSLIEDAPDDEKLFRFVHRYGKPLEFAFMGRAITFSNLYLFSGRNLRGEEQSKSETAVAEKLNNGRLSSLLDFYLQHNEPNDELDGLKRIFSIIQGKSPQAIFEFLEVIGKDEIVTWFVGRFRERLKQLLENPPAALKKSAPVSISETSRQFIDTLQSSKILSESEIQRHLEFYSTYVSGLAAVDEVKQELEYPDLNQDFRKALRLVSFHQKRDYAGYIEKIHEETENLRREEMTREEETIREIQSRYEQRLIAGITIPFGGCDWRVLDVQNNRALIITKDVIEKRSYNVEYTSVTWETCTLREYLNGEFLQKFAEEERKRIEETAVANLNNQWYGTNGGNDTTDRVFLLSFEEIVKYFGDSGQLRNKNPKSEYRIDDRYNSARKTVDADGKATWWWLRSPGFGNGAAARVEADGDIGVVGGLVNTGQGGVRPVLWLHLRTGGRMPVLA